MALNLGSPWISRFSGPSQNLFKTPATYLNNSSSSNALFFLLLCRCSSQASAFNPLFYSPSSSPHPNFRTRASFSVREDGTEESSSSTSGLLDDELLSRVSVAKDANKAMEIIAENTGEYGGVVQTRDCCSIIAAALERNNVDLALSVFSAMRSSFDEGVDEKGSSLDRWKWTRPDARTYALLVRGLAASLRVSDATRMLTYVSHVGVSPGEEVPFGKIVRCPSCMIAIAVAQPQQGTQVASCSKCRYQYELVSGDIVGIESEEIRIYSCRTQHGYISMGKGAKIPANFEAEHSCCYSLHCGPDPHWDCFYI